MNRCFVASLPSPTARVALDRLAASLQPLHPGSRRVTAPNLHLTLAFIGDLPDDRLPHLAATLAAQPVPQDAAWRIDRVGCFANARVLWAGGPPCAPLEAQSEAVRALLRTCRVAFDPRPFAPHVTLLRGVSRLAVGEPVRDAVSWPLGPALLMRSAREAGVLRYRPVTVR